VGDVEAMGNQILGCLRFGSHQRCQACAPGKEKPTVMVPSHIVKRVSVHIAFVAMENGRIAEIIYRHKIDHNANFQHMEIQQLERLHLCLHIIWTIFHPKNILPPEVQCGGMIQ